MRRSDPRAGFVAAILAALAGCHPVERAPVPVQPPAESPSATTAPATPPPFEPISLVVPISPGAEPRGEPPQISRPRPSPGAEGVTVWIVTSPGDRTEAIYAVGQPRGPCGPLLAGILDEASESPELTGATFVYGVAALEAGGDPAKQAVLGRVRERLESAALRWRRPSPGSLRSLRQEECPFTEVKKVAVDATASGEDPLAHLAPRLLAAAARSDRPILLWHDLGEVPRLVPASVGAAGRPLSFTLRVDQLSIPQPLPKALTMDGVAPRLRELRVELAKALATHRPRSSLLGDSELDHALHAVQEMEARGPHRRREPLPALVDAFLRGWPATFAAPRAEWSYDQWLKQHQRRVWDEIGAALGCTLADAKAALLREDVVFQVSESPDGSELTVVPRFLVAGPTFQIADAGGGAGGACPPKADTAVVRYAPATAARGLP